METIKIQKIRKIAKDANGNALNIVLIDLGNGKPSIVRNNEQFLQDLKNSYLIDESVRIINHPQVLEVLRDIRGGSVSGNITYHKKGEMWTVNETSRAITDPTHPEFGNVSVGDKLAYESDGTRVEGFLDLTLPMDARAIRANASAYANAEMSMRGAFDSFEPTVSTSATESSEEPVISKAVLNEILATETVETVETVEKPKKK